MSLTVKAYFQKKPDESLEIRRFTIPVDVSSSYEYMFKRVSEVFPSLNRGNFVICWKDPEQELVALSSDDELLEALGFVENGILKIFIKEKKSAEEQQKEEQTGELHPHVVCDGCEGAVYGVRYKCCVCPDYDLCSPCEGKGLHNQHDMLKIASPRAAGGKYPFVPPPHFRRWMRRCMNRMNNNHAEGSADLNGAPGTSGEKMETNQGQTDTPTSGTTGGTTAGNPGEATPGKPECEETSAEEEYLKKWGECISAMMDPFGVDVTFETDHKGRRKFGGKCGRRGRHGRGPFGQYCPSGPQGPAGPHGFPGPHGGPHGFPGPHGGPHGFAGPHGGPHGFSGPHGGPHGFPGYHSAPGFASFGFAGPFGHFGFAGPQGPPPYPEQGSNPGCPFTGTGYTMNADSGESSGESMENQHQTTVPSENPEAQASPKQTEQINTSTDSSPARDNDWTVLDQDGSLIQPSSDIIQGLHNITIVQKEQPSKPTDPVVQPVVQPDVQPLITLEPATAVPEPVHSDPKIVRSVEQMVSMGFSNEGGWLTHLLEAKGGDISQALDSIRPMDRRTNGGHMA